MGVCSTKPEKIKEFENKFHKLSRLGYLPKLEELREYRIYSASRDRSSHTSHFCAVIECLKKDDSEFDFEFPNLDSLLFTEDDLNDIQHNDHYISSPLYPRFRTIPKTRAREYGLGKGRSKLTDYEWLCEVNSMTVRLSQLCRWAIQSALEHSRPYDLESNNCQKCVHRFIQKCREWDECDTHSECTILEPSEILIHILSHFIQNDCCY